MPTKTTAKLRKKGVVVSIYVEKPTNRKNTIHHHHHYCVHNTIKQQQQQQEQYQTGNSNSNDIAAKGHNRRAELLLYSRCLRESARQNPLVSPFRSPKNVGVVQRKPKHNKAPTCPINWKIFDLDFCSSLKSVETKQGNKKNNQTGRSIKLMIKGLEATKKKGFVPRFLSMLQKSR